MRKLALFLFLFTSAWLEGTLGNTFYIGPEVFHMKRWRDGGTYQTGRIDGIKIGYDRTQVGCLYLGGDALYASGKLKGTSRRGSRLRSDLTDHLYEGRLGVTLGLDFLRCTFFSPFGGYGYFCEKNKFRSPSPIPFTFTDTYQFIVAGFLSGFNLTPEFSMGLNFKIRFMNNGKSKVTDDPDFDDVTLIMNNESQYRVEIPMQFQPCQKHLGVEAIPFYEHRHLGGREGFPFDFVDTKFDLFGMRFALTYWF